MLLLLLLLLNLSGNVSENVVDDGKNRACHADMRLNHVQFIGTHNSYKMDLTENLATLIEQVNPGGSVNIRYGHPTVTYQLENIGIRKFELDVFLDPDGGRFARPLGATLTNDTDFIDHPDMLEPGLKVLHAQDVDYRSTCLTFISCLEEIRNWSQSNSNHLPIMIMIELKEGQPGGNPPMPFTTAIPFTEESVLSVDEEILRVFPVESIITPDFVRKGKATLESSILENGWPTIDESRGKVLFAMDNTGRQRDLYLAPSNILENRMMFVSSNPGEPSAAFIKMNNSLTDEESIRERVKNGYLIRSRTDIPMVEAVSMDYTRMEAAFRSGAQYVSTDFPRPASSGFVVRFDGAQPMWRCNPVLSPNSCNADCLTE